MSRRHLLFVSRFLCAMAGSLVIAACGSAEGGGDPVGAETAPTPPAGPGSARPDSGVGVALERCLVDAGHARPELAGITSVIRSMPANSWKRINRNTFFSVLQPAALRPACTSWTGPTAIINAWGGFAYDSRRSDLLIFGGGHADYCGNDIYRFRLSTMQWERAGISSQMTIRQMDESTQTAIPADGLAHAPPTSHMYDQLTFLPNADRMIYFGGRPFWSGRDASAVPGALAPHTGPWLFDPDRADPDKVVGSDGSAVDPGIAGGNMWQNREFASSHPGNDLPVSFGGPQTSTDTVCSREHDVVLVRTGGRHGVGSTLFQYAIPSLRSVADDSLVRVSADSNHMAQADLAVDPERAIAVVTGDSVDRPFAYWDLNTAGPTNPLRTIPRLMTDGAFSFNTGYGMEFDPLRDRFVLWNGRSAVWELRAPPGERVSPSGWRISRLLDHGGPDDDLRGLSGGANGKWKYAPELDVFVGLREAPAGDIWIYKPSGWTDPALR